MASTVWRGSSACIGPWMATATASHPNDASIPARGAAIPAVRDAARRLARGPEDLDGVLAVAGPNCGAVDGGCPCRPLRRVVRTGMVRARPTSILRARFSLLAEDRSVAASAIVRRCYLGGLPSGSPEVGQLPESRSSIRAIPSGRADA